ncbi:MAG: ATP-dependent sacrificial sulfur transferase LarE [Gemmatimonadaceae bacterium]
MSAAVAPTSSAIEREEALTEWFRQFGSVAIGFSGGVDSSYLAAVAVDAVGRENSFAIIGRSDSYPDSQWQAARELAAQIDIPVIEIDTNELADERYASNPANRCYFCKSELWTKLAPIARERFARTHGAGILIDGTNADDLSDHRPGAKAAMENGVRSPLAEIGMTKSEIRDRSRARGLPTWSKPSSPCLASRIPYGTPVTTERLQRIERAEAAIRSLGFVGNLRVRDHGDLARIELDVAEVDRALAGALSSDLAERVRAAGFARVAVDVAGFRSGSLNVLEGIVAE